MFVERGRGRVLLYSSNYNLSKIGLVKMHMALKSLFNFSRIQIYSARAFSKTSLAVRNSKQARVSMLVKNNWIVLGYVAEGIYQSCLWFLERSYFVPVHFLEMHFFIFLAELVNSFFH
jgi:hypothetical protein